MFFYQRLVARLLHYANASPPFNKTEFYEVKDRLLKRYGTLTGSDTQEISKDCWGERRWRPQDDWNYDGDEDNYEQIPCGPKCRRCGGTGIFDIRWILLERWRFGRFTFHRPTTETRKEPASVSVRGRIEHKDYGRLSNEAALWLYLLTAHFGLFWRTLRSSRTCGWTWFPLLNVQKIVTRIVWKLHFRRCCSCDKRYCTWGSGWQICSRCRNTEALPPF